MSPSRDTIAALPKVLLHDHLDGGLRPQTMIEIAAEIGTTPPKERFSEIELEARIRRTLADPSMQSWEDTTATGREHGVPVARRGHNVGYGMMLMQPDGTLTEPSRAHTRRGHCAATLSIAR